MSSWYADCPHHASTHKHVPLKSRIGRFTCDRFPRTVVARRNCLVLSNTRGDKYLAPVLGRMSRQSFRPFFHQDTAHTVVTHVLQKLVKPDVILPRNEQQFKNARGCAHFGKAEQIFCKTTKTQ